MRLEHKKYSIKSRSQQQKYIYYLLKKVEGSFDFTEKLSRCCNGVGDLWSSFHDIYFYFLRFHIFEVKQPLAKLIIETKNEMNIQTFSLKQNPLILIWQVGFICSVANYSMIVYLAILFRFTAVCLHFPPFLFFAEIPHE